MAGNTKEPYHLLISCFFHGFYYSIGCKILININYLKLLVRL